MGVYTIPQSVHRNMGAECRRGFRALWIFKISKIGENLLKRVILLSQIEIMDAARVKPGLQVAVNVKFSPIYEEEVTAEIAFLTLSPDYDQNFHEFRVYVHCTPQIAMPILDPDELRWKSKLRSD